MHMGTGFTSFCNILLKFFLNWPITNIWKFVLGYDIYSILEVLVILISMDQRYKNRGGFYMQINNNTVNASASYNYAMGSGSANQDEEIKSLQEQIENVQKQLQSLSDNKELSPEELTEKKKELQQQLQDLNKQITQRKIEIQKEKNDNAASKNNNDKKDNATGMTTDEIGVLITFSSAEDQMTGMNKIKTDLEGKLRTARTEEEKTELQKKIDNITNSILEKAKEIGDTITEHQKDTIDEGGHKQAEKTKEDKTAETEENKVNSPDSVEQKIGSSDEPVLYTKTGETTYLEPEVKISVLV